jgi:hypothetical protein
VNTLTIILFIGVIIVAMLSVVHRLWGAVAAVLWCCLLIWVLQAYNDAMPKQLIGVPLSPWHIWIFCVCVTAYHAKVLWRHKRDSK